MTSRWRSSTPGEMFAHLAVEPHLWILTLELVVDAASEAAHLRLLSEDERVRYHRYLRDTDRELFLVAHVFARQTLSRYASIAPADWVFETNEHGRPEIANADSPPGLRFNLAHTAGMVAMLVHDTTDGGVDVEHVGNATDPVSLSKTVFADAERRDYLSLDENLQEQRFYMLWTLKESFIKAKGKGLAIPLKDFAFTGLGRPEIQVACASDIETEPAAWHFTVRQPSPGFVVATAHRPGLERQSRSLSTFQVNSLSPPGWG